MRVAIVHNPAAGRGRGGRVGAALAAAAERAGHEVRALAVRREPGFGAALAGACAGAEVLVAVGGDGTLHHALGPALASGAAVYHAPLGNENLFARRFGMSAEPGALVLALAAGRRVRVDVAWAAGAGAGAAGGAARGGRAFVLMCSVGFDAGVIRRLSRGRRRAVGYRAYARPLAAEWLAPSLPEMWIEADGRVLVEGRRGLAVVANSREYAMRLDPAARASMSDGLLDVVFFPAASRWAVLRWAMLTRLGRHVLSPELVYVQARDVRLVARDGGPGRPARAGVPVQLDGEAADVEGFVGLERAGPGDAPAGLDLRVGVEAGALAVLAPP